MTDTIQTTGGVQCLSWTPDGCAIAVAWSWACHGGLAVWSVFGSLLMCTLGGDYGYLNSKAWLFDFAVLVSLLN